MCGIVGGIAERDIVATLLDGLKRLEYRGYDSAGIAISSSTGEIERLRVAGKVARLKAELHQQSMHGLLGIAHTRWATHGKPNERNAHPHLCERRVAVVHNGIIENHQQLRQHQLEIGYRFTSDTDTEVIVHQIHYHQEQGCDLLAATQAAVAEFEGAYALAVMTASEPHKLVVARRGSPLVIGLGSSENFVASDLAALSSVTRHFIFLEEGDIAEITCSGITIYDEQGLPVKRSINEISLAATDIDRGPYQHYMLKEIFEQPQVIIETLEGHISSGQVLEEGLGPHAESLFRQIKSVQIIACGTSFHAGLVARNWFEGLAGIPCHVEVASEFRYRHPVPDPDALVIAISQSGETADTLAALQATKKWGYCASLAICNVPQSSLVREADIVLMTRAGIEIGVASTKAFTAQLVALLLLVIIIGRHHGLSSETQQAIVEQLLALPRQIEQSLAFSDTVLQLAERLTNKHHALFLGRGVQYPVAMEGALKLKELSYIHAEAYPAGELKHGPLALIDEAMPIIAVAPNDALRKKLKSNLEEVRARGGELYIFTDHESGIDSGERVHVTVMPVGGQHVAPILFTVPLQLLAYHVAVLKGTDVDQPRNLAKSVTVE